MLNYLFSRCTTILSRNRACDQQKTLPIMDSPPPPPPNDRGNNGNTPIKPNANNNERQQQQAPVEVFDINAQDAPVVIAFFLFGVATWFLKERCVC